MLAKLYLVFIFLFCSSIASATVGEQWIAGALDVGSFPVEEDSKHYKNNQNIDVEWNKVPKIRNIKQLYAYMHKCTTRMMTSIPIVCIDGFNPKIGDSINATSVYWINWTVVYEKNNEKRFICNLIYRSGARIAHAYLTGDRSGLTKEELLTYKKAIQIVNKIKSMKVSKLEKLLRIHDKITGICDYYTEKFPPYPTVPHFTTALGVFIDHKANCQGYSDSFYMLGTMAGFNVGYLHGIAGGGKHIWNTIDIDDKTYCMDVTWDDKNIRLYDKLYSYYVYFIAPREIMKMTHSWDKNYEVKDIEDDIDDNYFYATLEHYDTNRKYFGSEEDSAEAGLTELADGIANERWQLWYVMVPYDKYYCNVKNSIKYLNNELNKAKYKCSYYMNVSCNPKRKYMFYTVFVR